MIERASDADLAFLAIDRGPVPEQLAVALILDRPLSATTCARLLAERVTAVPRLRQRLLRTPPACGPPIWSNDENFAIERHFHAVDGPPAGAVPAVIDSLMPWVVRPLPRDRPLWRAVLTGGGCVLLLVVHHALSDGLGGLAVLGRLLDPAEPVPSSPSSLLLPALSLRRPPSSRPAAWHLAAGAWRDRAAALRAQPARLRRLRIALAAGGGLNPGRLPPSSLLRPTTARRRAVVVRASLAGLREAAHRNDAGVNAALLVAVADALRHLVEERGETLDTVAIAVPVGMPHPAGTPGSASSSHLAGALGSAKTLRPAEVSAGNASSPLVVAVPAGGARAGRLALVAAEVRGRRAEAAGPSPVTVLGGWFRLFARMGGYRWYMRRQRRLHTLVSHLRGPDRAVCLGGVRVRAMIPVVVGGGGNLTVSFVALSYLDELVVTVVADPDRCPDLDRLGELLSGEFSSIASTPHGEG
ncbi:WS/DGAT/MGAT family acyltransferase [Actinoplanes tereljensis]|uniref:diacylglycerol O-acyltransferase n=1 Tax=Paractinoplanes tereljensis TaxID=571912 RepID=A0A919TW50_9ACTN|nr:wax ester/triacylglycerol synthase domain-containing protein [Actinoplanes tereljensis]GIF22567.1 hypothetical protein Ate02nite_52970 [Actinoplanes tereljensis]